MFYLTSSFVPTECYVRDAFLFNMEPGHTGKTKGLIVGFHAIPQQVPMFQVMLENGAMWAKMPVHALCWKQEAPTISPTEASFWDSFSSDFTIAQFDILRGYGGKARSKTGKMYDVQYIATIDWLGRWASLPGQHKQHHLLREGNGNFLMYPNNRIRWYDPAWQNQTDIPRYKINCQEWSCEVDNVFLSDAWDYEEKNDVEETDIPENPGLTD